MPSSACDPRRLTGYRGSRRFGVPVCSRSAACLRLLVPVDLGAFAAPFGSRWFTSCMRRSACPWLCEVPRRVAGCPWRLASLWVLVVAQRTRWNIGFVLLFFCCSSVFALFEHKRTIWLLLFCSRVTIFSGRHTMELFGNLMACQWQFTCH